MIVKIWPIKENKHSGIVGALKNSTDYVKDEEKTMTEISEVQELENGYLLGTNDISAALDYIANEEKIMKKYVSGINCDPDFAIEQFMEVKEKNLARVGKTLDNDSCNHAFHIVQSFEDDKKLTPDLVHQCGIELAKKLGYYQAIVCTHVPGDYEGSGKHYHNHIIFNSHSFDPMKQHGSITRMKYNDCKDTYRQLRKWNDEIALSHDLSIIKEPDNSKTYNWYEWNKSKSGESWKEQVRMDIENTKSVSKDWGQFKKYLIAAGYQIREGKYITYTTPEGNKVRDNKLGKSYTKEFLDNYWISKEKINQEISENINTKNEINKSEYYFNPNRCSTKTKKPYAVRRHNKFGKKRSTLELSFMLAAVIIKNETPPSSTATYSKTDWKLQNMIDAVKIARDANIETIGEIEKRLNQVGKQGNTLKQQLQRYENTYNKMEVLGKAIETYQEVKDICEEIKSLPEGMDKTLKKEEYQVQIEQYKKAKSVMYKHKVTTDEDIDDFLKRYNSVKNNIETTSEKLINTKENYRNLKKLEYQSKLAENDTYCYNTSLEKDIASDFHRSISR